MKTRLLRHSRPRHIDRQTQTQKTQGRIPVDSAFLVPRSLTQRTAIRPPAPVTIPAATAAKIAAAAGVVDPEVPTILLFLGQKYLRTDLRRRRRQDLKKKCCRRDRERELSSSCIPHPRLGFCPYCSELNRSLREQKRASTFDVGCVSTTKHICVLLCCRCGAHMAAYSTASSELRKA